MSTSSRFAVAVHLLTLMAWSDEDSLKSEQMAGSVNTNPVVIRRMLCELAQDELVVSHTGSMGGSQLARKPGQITLLDVYRAIECPGVFSLHRQHPSRRCPVGANIETVLDEVRGQINSAIENVLAEITIEDILARLKTRVHGHEIKLREASNERTSNKLTRAERARRIPGPDHSFG